MSITSGLDQPTSSRAQTTLKLGAATHAGLSGKHNEDSYTLFETRLQGVEDTAQAHLVQIGVVADGIGGAVAGEQASSLAVQTIQQIMSADLKTPLAQRLESAIKQANSRIYESALKVPTLKGMGTTVVAGAVVDEYLYVAHAGDSRAYLVRGGIAYQLTRDHTWAQEAIEQGYLSPAEAAKHPNRNVIKRYLGIQPDVEVDSQIIAVSAVSDTQPEQTPPAQRPIVDHITLKAGDTVLLCSDGLTDVVQDAVIQQIVIQHQPQKAAEKLIEAANQAGGPDNITAVLLHWPDKNRFQLALPRGLMLALTGLIILLLVGGGAFFALSGASNGNIATPSPPATSTEIPSTSAMAAIEEPTETATATSTLVPPTSTPSPTAMPTVTPTASATLESATTPITTTVEAIAVTSTLAPTHTPTPTSTATSTPTVTPTPSDVESTPAIDPDDESIIILSSPDDEVFPAAGGAEFVWQWGATCERPPDYGFEIRVWPVGDDTPRGAMDAEKLQDEIECTDGVWRYEISNLGEATKATGTFHWDVILARIVPEYDRADLQAESAENFSFSLSGSSSDDDPGNNNDGGHGLGNQ